MECIMIHAETRGRRFAAVLTFAVLLFTVSPTHGQYMSFFGDSTWKYQYTLISRPPQDYMDYPPETPNLLGVYCITMSSCILPLLWLSIRSSAMYVQG